MANSNKSTFELIHFYPNIEQQKFWDFFIDNEWYSQSDIMPGELILEKPGKDYPQGLGAVRIVKVNENINLTEDIVGYDAPRYFAYAPREGGMPVNEYKGEFFYESKDGGMIWKYKGSFVPKYFGTAWFFKWFLRKRMKTMLPVWEKGYKAYYQEKK